MTTARSSSRSSRAGALALALVLLAGGALSAHRRDEYLQAARVSIDPDSVRIALDLTPGISVAEGVLAEIDLDRDGSISDREAETYSAGLLNAIALDLDGEPLRVTLLRRAFPAVGTVLNGEGTMRIEAAAVAPRLADGPHQLRFRNSHRPDVGAYLANTLVPADDRVTVTAQRRDPDQRDLVVEYTLRADATTRTRHGLSVGIAGALVWLTAVWWRRPRSA